MLAYQEVGILGFRTGMKKNADESDRRRSFLEFAAESSVQTWVAAHITREFPRLVCGAIWSDHAGNLNICALPNSSKMPLNSWEANLEAVFEYYRMLRRQAAQHIGFFSTRSPGKPPTPEGLEIVSDRGSFVWVISTTAKGKASEYGIYEIDTRDYYSPISPIVSLARSQHEVFSEQSEIISNCVQEANRELMAWLRKHPEDLLQVHPGTFELIIAEIFRDQGYDVEVIGSWNASDGGVDVIAIRKDTKVGEFRVGIQCKRYVKTRVVSADLIWALNSRLDKFHLHKGVIATTAKFEKSVLVDLENHLWRIDLRDYSRLKKDLEEWGQFSLGATGLWLPRE